MFKLGNDKIFNILVFTCIFAYIFAFFGTYFNENNKLYVYDNLYDTLIKDTNDFNSALKDETNSNNDNSNNTAEVPMFTDAKEAVISAYNKTVGQPYETLMTGTVSAGSAGINVDVLVESHEILYKNNSYFTEKISYEQGGKFGQTKSVKSFYKNNTKWINITKNVNQTADGKLIPNYTNGYEKQNNVAMPIGLIVNETTIAKTTYFKINYNVYTGKIESYSASVILKPVLAAKGYAKQVQIEGELASTPIFSKLEINCVIGTNGLLKSMNVKEEFSSTINIMGGMSFNSKDNFTYFYKNIGKTPSLPEPNV